MNAQDYEAALASNDYDTVSAAYERCMKVSHDRRFRYGKRVIAQHFLPKLTAHMRDVAEAKIAELQS